MTDKKLLRSVRELVDGKSGRSKGAFSDYEMATLSIAGLSPLKILWRNWDQTRNEGNYNWKTSAVDNQSDNKRVGG